MAVLNFNAAQFKQEAEERSQRITKNAAALGTANPADLEQQKQRIQAAAAENAERAEVEADAKMQRATLPTPQLDPIGLRGILGEITAAGCRNTEAVPETVALHTLARFSAILGRGPFVQIGDQQRFLNIFALIVGPTSHGRKGTSEELPSKIYRAVAQLGGPQYKVAELGSLATGEGLIHQVRDSLEVPPSGSRPGFKDPGVADKRLYLSVSEFAGVLAQFKREGSTLSAVLRDAYDGKVLTIPTKTSFNRATNAHIVCVGSVPETEIKSELSDQDKSNGLANRFPMFFATRSKLVPIPPQTDPQLIEWFANRIGQAVTQAWARFGVGAVPFGEGADELWREFYIGRAKRSLPAVVQKLMARAEVTTWVFAALISLINGGDRITVEDLRAAMAWTNYWERTLMFVFADGEEATKADELRVLADSFVMTVRIHGGKAVSHSTVMDTLSNHGKRKEMSSKVFAPVVELLLRESPPRLTLEKLTTGGRPAILYTLTDHAGP